jgi:tetratricopeptide (TPR) repeat protein
MPLSTSDVLDAYRADLSNAGRSEFSDSDATWLAFGTLLQRAASLPGDDRAAYLQTAAARIADSIEGNGPLRDALAMLGSNGYPPGALCDAVGLLAGEAEDAGAFALATAMLDFARILVGLGEVLLQGRLLAQQARILRKIGEVELARDLFDEVGDMGRTHGDAELVARSHLGKAVLARVRGNYPEAREEFDAVLAVRGSSPELRELQVHAHHGLLIVSAIAQDFDRALRHGAMAVAGAAREAHRIELQQNLAAICYDVGQYRAALNAYLQVLAADPALRVRIGCFGGAAVAASRLGEAGVINALAKAVGPLLIQRGHEFELADMTREFADAYAYLGDVERSAAYREEALERARRGKFFEIVHRVDALTSAVHVRPSRAVVLTGDALEVAAHLASGDSEQLLAAAVSSGHSDWNSR